MICLYVIYILEISSNCDVIRVLGLCFCNHVQSYSFNQQLNKNNFFLLATVRKTDIIHFSKTIPSWFMCGKSLCKNISRASWFQFSAQISLRSKKRMKKNEPTKHAIQLFYQLYTPISRRKGSKVE